MAKIVHSEAAPSEAVHYSFAGVEFDLGGRKKPFESDDPTVLSSAEAHPWLSVEREPVEVVQGSYVQLLDPKDDRLSAENDFSNDPEAAKAAEAAKADNNIDPVAIDAAKDQDEPVSAGPVDETRAAQKESE